MQLETLIVRTSVKKCAPPTSHAFARCLVCDKNFYDTEDGRHTGVWCDHVSLVFNQKECGWQQERGEMKDVLWFWRWRFAEEVEK